MNNKNTKASNLKKLFKETNFTQEQISKKIGMSTKTFQRILNGQLSKYNWYEKIAATIEQKLNRPVNISDIYEKTNSNEVRKSSGFRLSEDDYQIERCNLYNLSDMPDVNKIEEIILSADKQKVFMPTFYERNHKDASLQIQNIMNELLRIREKDDFDDEEFSYDKISKYIHHKSNFPQRLTKLKNFDVSMFMGNFHHPFMTINQYENDDVIHYDFEINSYNYAIIYFKQSNNPNESSERKTDMAPIGRISFNYRNQWYQEKLDWFVKRSNKSKNFNLPQNYSNKIDRSKVSLEETDTSLFDYIYESYPAEIYERVIEDVDPQELLAEQYGYDVYDDG